MAFDGESSRRNARRRVAVVRSATGAAGLRLESWQRRLVEQPPSCRTGNPSLNPILRRCDDRIKSERVWSLCFEGGVPSKGFSYPVGSGPKPARESPASRYQMIPRANRKNVRLPASGLKASAACVAELMLVMPPAFKTAAVVKMIKKQSHWKRLYRRSYRV
jgi:hypothetical protein